MELDVERIQTDWCRLILAFFLYILSLIMNLYVIAIIHDIVDREKPLPDLLFSLIPEQEWGWKIADAAVGISAVVTFTAILLIKHRTIVWRRAFTLLSVLYWIRSFCLCATQLPVSFDSAAQYCKPPHSFNSTVLMKRILKSVLSLGMVSGTTDGILCGDLLFSGHTSFLVLNRLIFARYLPLNFWPIRWVLSVLTLFGAIGLVIGHAHYTIDIIFGYILTQGVFSIYHFFCELPHTQRPNSSIVTHLWIFWLFIWLEINTPVSPLPRILEWPFRYPKSMVTLCEEWSKGSEKPAPKSEAARKSSSRISLVSSTLFETRYGSSKRTLY